ncbi:hypothetical protein C8J56DRAFT_1059152 [Mycena floridula]|nr:hypothetical protein C8J56DRAFT_1059152 [Mycena floridula]
MPYEFDTVLQDLWDEDDDEDYDFEPDSDSDSSFADNNPTEEQIFTAPDSDPETKNIVSAPDVLHEKTNIWREGEELPGILKRWWKPPNNSKRRAQAAGPAMEAFAADCMNSIFDKELAGLAELLKSPASDDTKVETLIDIDIDYMIARARETAPRLWTASQEKRNTMKDPNKVCLKYSSERIPCSDCLHYLFHSFLLALTSS